MKMITAIVNIKDSNSVCKSLTSAGFFFTKISTTGGFLTAGNTTLLIGTDDDKVHNVIEIIKTHCSSRKEILPSSNMHENQIVSYPIEVSVGGAIVFVTNVEHFEKL